MPAPANDQSDQATPSGRPSGLVSLAAGLLILVILVIIFDRLASLLQPFFIAIFFFYLGRPLARKLIEYRVPPAAANLAIIAVAIAVLGILGWVITAHVDGLKEKAPAYNAQFQQTARSTLTWVGERVPIGKEEVKEFLGKQKIPTDPLVSLVGVLVGLVFGSLADSLLIIFYLTFLNGEAFTLPARLEAAYGAAQASNILDIGERINNGIIRYVYVKTLASVLVAVLSLGALLAFRVDLAILWATLIFFGNFIPYIGSFAAVVFPVLIVALQFGSLPTTIFLAVILILCQIVVSNILEPMFAGQHLNLSPLVVMLSLAFWGWLWGIIGLILSVPIMMALKLVFEHVPATHEIGILLSQVPDRPKPTDAGAASPAKS